MVPRFPLGMVLALALVIGWSMQGGRATAGGEQSLIESVPVFLSEEKHSDFKANQKGVYVGKVRGTAAFIGIKVVGDRVVAYLCDDQDVEDDDEGSLWRWLEGEFVNGVANLESDGVEVTLRMSGNRITGSATVQGGIYPLSASQATTPGAGLFRSPEQIKIGGKSTFRRWIYLNNGEFRGDNRFLSLPCEVIINMRNLIEAGGVRIFELPNYLLVVAAYEALLCWRVDPCRTSPFCGTVTAYLLPAGPRSGAAI